MDSSMLIKLTRSGRFHAKTMQSNPHKCAAMRTRTYAYWVSIEGTDSRLSPEGYLFNNERVQEYFDTRFGVKAPKWDAISCELLALTAAKELAGIMLNEGIDIQCVECQILGSNGAQIKGIWTPTNVQNRGDNANDSISMSNAD
jgi:hypothetical protein